MSTVGIIVVAVVGGVVLTAAVLFLAMPRQPRGPQTAKGPGDLDAYFTRITGKGMPPALNVSVTKHGVTVYQGAFGHFDAAGNQPTAPDTIYPWWSVTKLATSVAVLRLVEEGRIGLDDTLSSHFPYFTVVDKKGRPAEITIRQVLNHRAGLRDIMPDGLRWIRQPDEPAVNQTDLVRERFTGSFRRLTFEPDTDTRYINTGYILLGAVVEKVTGRSFESYVREIILDPLNMDDTAFVRSAAQQDRTAIASVPVLNIYAVLLWIYGEKGFFGSHTIRREKGRIWLSPVYTDYTPSSGLSGSARDMAVFGHALMNGIGAGGYRLLDAATIEEMQLRLPLEDLPTRYGTVDRFGYGLKAWKVDGLRVYGHGGGGPGYGALLAFLPDEGLVVTVNANDGSVDKDEILRVLIAPEW